MISRAGRSDFVLRGLLLGVVVAAFAVSTTAPAVAAEDQCDGLRESLARLQARESQLADLINKELEAFLNSDAKIEPSGSGRSYSFEGAVSSYYFPNITVTIEPLGAYDPEIDQMPIRVTATFERHWTKNLEVDGKSRPAAGEHIGPGSFVGIGHMSRHPMSDDERFACRPRQPS